MAVRLDGQPLASETRLTDVGAYVLVLSTCLPDRGVDLYSTYVGDGRHAVSRAVHLAVAPGGSARSWAEEFTPDAMPVWHARRRCLFDHVQQMQATLEEHGHAVAIDVADDAVAEIERLATVS